MTHTIQGIPPNILDLLETRPSQNSWHHKKVDPNPVEGSCDE